MKRAKRVDVELLRVVRQEEGILQQRAVQEVEGSTGRDERTIRAQISEMDGTKLRVVRATDGNKLFTLPHWQLQEHRSYEERKAHTTHLKGLLASFRGQVPTVDLFGSEPTKDGVAPIAVSWPRMEYDPASKLPFEEDRRFDDLLFHLDLVVALGANVASLWKLYKDQVVALKAASAELRRNCEEWVEQESGIPKSRWGVREEVPDRLVSLLLELSVAQAERDQRKVEWLSDFPSMEVRQSGEFAELNLGSSGIIRMVGTKEALEKKMKRMTKRALTKLLAAAATDGFVGPAESVSAALAQASATRRRLLEVLDDATHVEVFPGTCRFVTAAAPLPS